jgi:hypothetical protein
MSWLRISNNECSEVSQHMLVGLFVYEEYCKLGLQTCQGVLHEGPHLLAIREFFKYDKNKCLKSAVFSTEKVGSSGE